MKTIQRQIDTSLTRLRWPYLLAPRSFLAFASAGSAQAARADKTAARLSEDQRILHVLNRLGFGARPVMWRA